MRNPILLDIALLVVVCLTVWAAVSSNRVSNEVQKTQDDLENLTACNQEYLSKTIVALNERTTYTIDQANANVELQRAQGDFLAVLLREPEASEVAERKAATDYVTALGDFVRVNEQQKNIAREYPFPTNKNLSACFDNREETPE
jgi:hypothetical protein